MELAGENQEKWRGRLARTDVQMPRAPQVMPNPGFMGGLPHGRIMIHLQSQLNCSCLCSSSMIRFDLSMIMRDVHHQRHGVPPPFACPCCPHGRMFIQISSPGDSIACTIALDCARPSSRGSNTTTWPCRRKGDDAPKAQSFLLAREAAALCCTHHQANTALACYWFLSHPSRSAL